MITRGSGEIDWYSYDLPAKIDDLSDSSYSEFWYGPDRSRIKQYQSATGATIRYADALFEFEDAATDTYRHYVQAGDQVVAVVERVSTTNTRQYLHRDHQGSVVKVTDASGNVAQALAFDAWGLRRNASDWSAMASPFAGSHETERGYTGHEHLDAVGLIHMNGRVQDPILGRFISADPFVQAPFNTQSHNRYSYVWNNPTSYIDPSGFQRICIRVFIGPVCGGNVDGLDEASEGGMIHTGLSPSDWEEMQRIFDQMDAERERYIDEWVSAGAAAASAGAAVNDGRPSIVDVPPTPVSTPDVAPRSTAELFIYTIQHHWKDILRGGVEGAREMPTGHFWVSVSGVDAAIETIIASSEGDVGTVVMAAAGIFAGKANAAMDILPVPNVLNQKLRNIINDLYKGTTNPNRVGNGTTADAIRHELATGQPVGGTFHSQKGAEYARALENWLGANPNAAYSDRIAAQSILDDLTSAMGGGL